MPHGNLVVLVAMNVVLLGACLVEWTKRPAPRVPAVIVALPVRPVVAPGAPGPGDALRTEAVIIALRPPVSSGVALSMARHPSSWVAAPALRRGGRRRARGLERSAADPRAVRHLCPTRVPAAVGGVAPSKVAARRAPFSAPLIVAVARRGRKDRGVTAR